MEAGADTAAASNNGWDAREWADELGYNTLAKWIVRATESQQKHRALAEQRQAAELSAVAELGNLKELDRLLRLEQVPPDALAPAKNLPGQRVEASALAAAARAGQLESARRLLEAGAKVGLADRTGVVPLHEAAGAGSAAVARLLLRAGAAVDVADRAGTTAYHYACWHNRVELLTVRLVRLQAVEGRVLAATLGVVDSVVWVHCFRCLRRRAPTRAWPRWLG